jgi:hypothetical protein
MGSQSYSWNVEKSHGVTSPLQVSAGQSCNVTYSITATATANAGGNAGQVTGAITAINTNPVTDAVINSVQAWINNTQATVTCPQPMISTRATYDSRGNVILGRLVCPFTVTLAAGETPSTVTGRVEQQLYDYDSENHPSANGTRVLQGTQPVGTLPGGALTDECVTLTDAYLGQANALGEFCVSPGQMSVTRSFTGAIAVTADSECEYSVANTARLVTGDTGATDESTTSVPVQRTDCEIELPTLAACTFTQGYWRTHSIVGPAPYDATWARVGESTRFFIATWNGSPLSWYDVMWMAPKGNAYFVLAPQFVAATLNTLAGASAPADVLATMDEAQQLFEAYTPEAVGALKGNNALRARFIDAAAVLDAYNNGQSGPGHCKVDTHALTLGK